MGKIARRNDDMLIIWVVDVLHLNPEFSNVEIGKIAPWLQHLVKMLVGVCNGIAVIASNTIKRTLAGKVRRVVDLWPCQ